MNNFKLIIAGSRNFHDYDLLQKHVHDFLHDQCDNNIVIISGVAVGADLLGEHYAHEMQYPVQRFPAEWNLYGKYAGHKRNEDMAKSAHACIVFWDGKSKGTKNMIDNAKKYNLKLKIVEY